MAISQPHEAIRDLLRSDSAVFSLLEDSDVRPWILWRTDELPAITYTLISHSGDWTFDGSLSWKQRRYQLGCWGATFDKSAELAQAVIDAIDGVQQDQRGNVYVHRLRIEDGRDDDRPPEDGAERPPYVQQLDAVIAYEINS